MNPARSFGFVLCLALPVSTMSCTLAQPGDAQPDRPPFAFEKDDEAFLDEVQLGCFNYFWHAVDPETGMVRDRTSVEFISVAGVGYQLAAIVVGDERGWVTHHEAEVRTLKIVRALHNNPDNRSGGVFYHFLAPGTAGPSGGAYEQVASTIDSAILFAGLITASSHFGGEIATLADELVAGADWASFVEKEHHRPFEQGFMSLGWEKPTEENAPFEAGLLHYTWADAGDEQKLIYFLSQTPPDEAHRLSPETYYRTRRTLGDVPGAGEVVWFPWSGALFTAFFAHCWIDYAAMGEDDPQSHGVEFRRPTDWWENSRRLVELHRQRARDRDRPFKGFGEHVWGLSACDGEMGYLVPGHFPKLAKEQLGQPQFDHLKIEMQDDWRDGTVAPYSAGSAIIFEPAAAMDALRHYRELARNEAPLLWADPSEGGYGFADSFRPNEDGVVEWVAPDRVAIDAGPMLICIENARTGLLWKTFGEHEYVRNAYGRLGLQPSRKRR
ncbi:MAG: hypothetical protein KDA31_10400 [Phycisphaerales bacterium]|nr:hypothetical protein [Phycisphaerales bacterium]MCB9837509.1 hypothetical protein [Phycisphaera sp.]